MFLILPNTSKIHFSRMLSKNIKSVTSWSKDLKPLNPWLKPVKPYVTTDKIIKWNLRITRDINYESATSLQVRVLRKMGFLNFSGDLNNFGQFWPYWPSRGSLTNRFKPAKTSRWSLFHIFILGMQLRRWGIQMHP